MADTNAKGLQGVRRARQEESIETTGSLPLYPPGPGDREAWKELLRRFPEVEPTFCKDGHMLPEMQETQSRIRRTPDGNPSGVDLRLRAIGNGVVPAVAARAFIVLTEKLKKEVDIPDIIKEMYK